MRIGNGAADQLQLDIYGEAMNSIHALDSGALGDWGVGHDGWNHIVAMIDWLCEHWHDPDEGIWETRGGRRSLRLRAAHVLGRVRPRHPHGDEPGPPRRPGALGRANATASTQQIMTKGWNDQLGAFVQYEGGDVLDASLVLMPLMGFIVPNDPRWQSTMAAMEQDAGRRQPRVPVRPEGVTRRSPRVGGNVLALHLPRTSTRSPAPAGSTRRG